MKFPSLCSLVMDVFLLHRECGSLSQQVTSLKVGFSVGDTTVQTTCKAPTVNPSQAQLK